MLLKQPYQFIAERFTLDGMAGLCDGLGISYANLPGSTPNSKAREIQSYMSRNLRMGDLLEGIKRLQNDFDPTPYLYILITEHVKKKNTIVTICQELKLDCQRLKLTTNDLFAYEANQTFRREKAVTLQTHMEEKGRVPELVQAIARHHPELNLKAYGNMLVEPASPPDEGKKVPEGESPPPPLPSYMTYENFDLRVDKTGDKYFVEVLESPEGQVKKIEQSFPLQDQEFYYLFNFLKGLVGAPEDAETLGKQMRQVLFPGDVWSKFRECRTAMKRTGKGLRLRLRIDPPELSQLPWEYCFDEQFDFLALNKRTPFMRYPPESIGAEPLQAKYPIRILLAMASPEVDNLAQVDFAVEERNIRKALKPLIGLELIQLDVIERVTARKLRKALEDGGYHILHYLGHGVIKKNGVGGLALETEDRQMRVLDAGQMRAGLRGSTVKVVILNACELAAHDGVDPFNSVARSLIRAGIPAVIAMQFKMPIKTAFLFSQELYESLATGKPLDQAITEVRKAAYFDVEEKDKNFWGIPVLFMRSKNGVIWQPDEEIAAKLVEFKAQPSGKQALERLLPEISQAFDGVKSQLDSGDVEDVQATLQDANELVQADEPDARRIERKLKSIVNIFEFYDSAVASPVVSKVKEAIGLVLDI